MSATQWKTGVTDGHQSSIFHVTCLENEWHVRV